MQSEADKVVNVTGKKPKIDRRRRASPRHTLDYVAIDDLSPLEIICAKRRKLSGNFEKVPIFKVCYIYSF